MGDRALTDDPLKHETLAWLADMAALTATLVVYSCDEPLN